LEFVTRDPNNREPLRGLVEMTATGAALTRASVVRRIRVTNKMSLTLDLSSRAPKLLGMVSRGFHGVRREILVSVRSRQKAAWRKVNNSDVLQVFFISTSVVRQIHCQKFFFRVGDLLPDQVKSNSYQISEDKTHPRPVTNSFRRCHEFKNVSGE